MKSSRNLQFCTICKSVIKMMCQKDTGVCCEKCRKKRDGE